MGIDLGTTNCCVAVFDGGRARVLASPQGSRTTPSVVAISDEGDRLVGQIAKRQAITNPENTVFAVKRLIGRKRDSPEVSALADQHLPYRLTEADNGDVRVLIGDQDFSPPEISSMILAELKSFAEKALGEDFDARIMDWLIDEFREECGIDLTDDRMALQRLKEAAERSKAELSNDDQAEINRPSIAGDSEGPRHLVKTLEREHFESLVADLVARTRAPCLDALEQARVRSADLAEVLLVGG